MTDFNDKFMALTDAFPYIRFVSAKIDADRLKVTLAAVYKKSREKDFTENKNRILAQAAKLLPPSARIELSASPSVFTSGEVMRCALDYLHRESAYVFAAVAKENIVIQTSDDPFISIGLPADVAEYAHAENIDSGLKKYIDAHLFSDITVRITAREEDMEAVRKVLTASTHRPKFSYERPEEGRRINPAGRTPYYGEAIEGSAQYICDCIEPGYTTLYGTMSDVKIHEYTPKKAQSEDEKRKFATFFLDDGTGKIRCVFFPGAKSQGALKYFIDGATVITEGKLDYDERLGDGSLQFRLTRISGCEKANYKVNNVVRLVDDRYVCVHPKKYVALSQSYLYSGRRAPLTKEPLVVFALLTSSQNKYAPGELIEIGAAKMVDGVITETFESLIRPHVEMTEEARLAAGLLASDLAGKPTYEQVVPDFYKFFDGYTLTAFPIDWNTNVLRPCFDKLHIPMPPLAEITKYADASLLRAARPKNTRRAMPAAEAYAKILANI